MSEPYGGGPPVAAATSEAERSQLVDRLHHVVASLDGELDLETVLQRICTVATELLHGDAGAFLLRHEESWRPAVLFRDGQPERWGALPVDALGGATAKQLRSPFVVADLEPSVRQVVRSALPDAYAGVGATVVACGLASGVLVVLYERPGQPPGPAQADVLTLLAEHAGVAITNARRYADAVRERRRQHAIVDATADGLAVLDERDRVVQWNRAAVRLTGLPVEEVRGGRPPFPVPLPGQVLDHRLPTGRWLEILCSNVPHGDDRVVDFRDVSQIRELDAEKDLFLATVGHELRTPITAIQGFASTLLRRWPDLSEEDRRRAVGVMTERSGALAELVDRVMLGSAVGQDGTELATTPVDLETLLCNVVAGFAPTSGKHRIELDLAGALPEVWGDSLALDRVASQLLENAIKFSPEGGEVTVRTWVSADCAGFSVMDCGVGMDSTERDRIFELFYQGGAGERRRFGGMGLGLYIVRQLVRAQDGMVSAHGAPGGGTELRVSLPVAPAHRMAELDHIPAERAS